MQPMTEQQKQFVLHNKWIAYAVTKRFCRRNPMAFSYGSFEDLSQEALLVLCRCSQGHDPLKGAKFNTYATKAIWSQLCRRVRRIPRTMDEVEVIPAKTNSHDAIIDMRIALLAVPSRGRHALNRSFGLDGGLPTTYRQIGRELDCSGQWVHDLIVDAKERLCEVLRDYAEDKE